MCSCKTRGRKNGRMGAPPHFNGVNNLNQAMYGIYRIGVDHTRRLRRQYSRLQSASSLTPRTDDRGNDWAADIGVLMETDVNSIR